MRTIAVNEDSSLGSVGKAANSISSLVSSFVSATRQSTITSQAANEIYKSSPTILVGPAFVRRRIQAEQSQDVHIPHSIDPSKESRSVFQVDVFVPFPLAFRNLYSELRKRQQVTTYVSQVQGSPYLSQDEADDSHGCTQECCQHEKLESVDDSLIEETPGRSHGRQSLPFGADVAEHAVNDERQEQEVNPRRHSSQDHETQLYTSSNGHFVVCKYIAENLVEFKQAYSSKDGIFMKEKLTLEIKVKIKVKIGNQV